MSIEIKKADESDCWVIHQLAHKIWWESYAGMLADEQIAFMLEQMYAVSALQEQMDKGDFFIIICDAEEAIGFASFTLVEPKVLRIHKLYFLRAAQGKGFGKMVLAYLEQEAQRQDAWVMELNVNRNNPAYYFYLKQGFEVKEKVDIPYYKFVLNDYIMYKPLATV